MHSKAWHSGPEEHGFGHSGPEEHGFGHPGPEEHGFGHSVVWYVISKDPHRLHQRSAHSEAQHPGPEEHRFWHPFAVS